MAFKMKKEVYISIKGVQVVDNTPDVTELFTQGSFYKKNDCYYIAYDETKTTGYDNSKTVLRIDGTKKVTLLRSGNTKSHLIIENGQRNVGHYGTTEGDMMIGVYAKEITNSLTDDGGDVYFRYDLDVNATLISENEVFVNVKQN